MLLFEPTPSPALEGILFAKKGNKEDENHLPSPLCHPPFDWDKKAFTKGSIFPSKTSSGE